MLTYHVFDYNLDFFEVGAIDDDRVEVADGPGPATCEARGGTWGLWGNHGYEAAYAMVYVDADGEQLNGGRDTSSDFDTAPPVDAFWSVTMYDMPGLLPRREPDRALLDRRPHPRAAYATTDR